MQSLLKKMTIVSTLAGLVLFFLIYPSPVLAQEDGFRETFDDPTLDNWERSQDVTVEDGVLRIYPGNLALHFGDWSEITLNIRLRAETPGETVIRYHFRDVSHYTLTILPDMVLLERFDRENSTPLGDGSFENIYTGQWFDLTIKAVAGQHEIQVNGQTVLQASDPEPLLPGAVLIQRFGEGFIEVDEISLNGQPGGPPGEMPPEEAAQPQGEPIPEVRSDEPQAGQPGTPLLPGEQTVPEQTSNLLKEFLTTQASQIELATFAINLLLSVIAAYVLSRVYIHWGASLSNRRAFAANFMLMTVTTTFIIMVVRSSVALSLGLVGALSIVRFRAAVKEPEELAYLFLAIGIGIGLGDNQRLLTLVTLLIAIVVLGLMRLLRSSKADPNLHLTVLSRGPEKLSLPVVMTALEPHSSKLKLLRLDENGDVMEASFLVEFRRLEQLNQATSALRSLSEGIEISYLDNKGIW